MDMRCPQCGTENPEGQINCLQCSASLNLEPSHHSEDIELNIEQGFPEPTSASEISDAVEDRPSEPLETEILSESKEEVVEKTQPIQVNEPESSEVSAAESLQTEKKMEAQAVVVRTERKQVVPRKKNKPKQDNNLRVFFIAFSITMLILGFSFVLILSLFGDQMGLADFNLFSFFEEEKTIEAPLPDNEVFLSGPLVLPADVISTQNVGQLSELAHIGKGWLGQVIFSPDGNLLIAPASLGVYFLNGQNLAEVQFLPMDKPVFRAAYSPNGSLLALAVGYEIQIYSLSESRLVASLAGHENTVSSVTFSPDGKFLLSSSWDRTVRLWQVADGSQVYRLRLAGEATSAAFSPDGIQFVVGLSDKTAGVFNTNDGSVTNALKGHDGAILSVAYSPDGKWIATGGNDKTAKIWNRADGKLERTLTWHDGPILALQFSPDGKTIATASSDGTVRVWSVPDGKPLQTLGGHASYVYGIRFSPDGKNIASTSTDGTVCLWDIGEGIRKYCKGGFTNYIYTVAVSEDMSYLAFGDESGKIQLLELSTGAVYPPLRGHKGSVRDLAFLPTSDQLISASSDGTIRQWMLPGGSLIRTLKGHEGVVNSIDLSGDGAWIVSGSGDGTIRLWNTNDGSQFRMIESLGMPVNDVVFSADNSSVLSGGDDRLARLWDVNSGEQILRFRGQRVAIKQVLFSQNDAQVLTADVDDLIRVWETTSQSWKASIVFGGDKFDHMALSPDNTLLAVAVFDQFRFRTIIEIYRMQDQALLTSLTGHTMPVSQLQFSPDGRWLISASEDGTIRFWGVQ
jgi:WD40 repeat protein